MTGAQQGRLRVLIAALLAWIATRRNKTETTLPTPYDVRVSAWAQQAQQGRNKSATNPTAPLSMGRNEEPQQAQHNPIGVLRVAPSAPVDCWAAQVRRALDI
jgi:hypothetical protein